MAGAEKEMRIRSGHGRRRMTARTAGGVVALVSAALSGCQAEDAEPARTGRAVSVSPPPGAPSPTVFPTTGLSTAPAVSAGSQVMGAAPTVGSPQPEEPAAGIRPQPAAPAGPAGRTGPDRLPAAPTGSAAVRATQVEAGAAPAPAPPPAGTSTRRVVPVPAPPVTPHAAPTTRQGLPVLTARLAEVSSDPDPSCARLTIAYTNSGSAAVTGGSIAVNLAWQVGGSRIPAKPTFFNATITAGLQPGRSSTESYRRCASEPAPSGGRLAVLGLGSALYY